MTLMTDVSAETAFIGSLILDPTYINKVRHSIRAAHFYDAKTGQIYKNLVAMSDANMPIDIVTIKDFLLKKNELEAVGGIDALLSMVNSVPTASNAEFYGHIVKTKFVEREHYRLAQEVVMSIESGKSSGECSSKLKEMERLREHINPPADNSELLECAIADIENCRNGYEITTGIDILDPLTMGLGRGKLVVVAADTSHGKTAFSLAITKANLERGIKVCYYTSDMSAKYIALRLAGIYGRVNTRKFCLPRNSTYLDADGQARQACYRDEELEDIKNILRGVMKKSKDTLTIKGFVSLHEVESDLAGGRADLVFIDYIQTAIKAEKSPAYKNVATQVDDYIAELKRIANKYNACVVGLSQFHRTNAEQLQKRQRQLSDLKESSSLEQGADVVIFLQWTFRELLGQGKTVAESRNYYNDYRIRVLKNNMGPVGEIDQHFDPTFQEFRNKENIGNGDIQ